MRNIKIFQTAEMIPVLFDTDIKGIAEMCVEEYRMHYLQYGCAEFSINLSNGLKVDTEVRYEDDDYQNILLEHIEVTDTSLNDYEEYSEKISDAIDTLLNVQNYTSEINHKSSYMTRKELYEEIHC